MSLTTVIKYNLKEHTFLVKSEVKKESVPEVIENWLRSQIGKGKDESKPRKQDVYTITLTIDLEDDSFEITTDTGNKSLTTGILMELNSAIHNKKDYVTFE